MNKKNRYPLRKKLKYVLDDFISKGFWAQILLLAGTSFLLTLSFGVITMNLCEETYTEGYWISLMHMLDQGTITADEVGTDAYFMFMLLVTFIGMAFTSTIIAIISSSIQGKLEELKKGHSGIIEKDHVVILGFDENANTISREIIEGSRVNRERVCLVIADDLPKEEMEHDFKEYNVGRQFIEKASQKRKNDKRNKILFRSGDPVSDNTLSVCAVHRAKAVVINRENDTETIRIILALAAYLKKNNAYLTSKKMPNIIALIHDRYNLSAAMAAAELSSDQDGSRPQNQHKIQILHDGNMLEKLFVRTCVQQGLPYVVDALFNYRGSSIRIEGDGVSYDGDDNPFIGKTLTDIANILVTSIPLGFIKAEADNQSRVLLNPSEDIRYQPGDRLIYLSEEAGLLLGEREHAEVTGMPAIRRNASKKIIRNFLLIGCSEKFSGMLKNVSESCPEGSSVSAIISESMRIDLSENADFTAVRCDDPYNWNSIRRILDEKAFWLDENDSRHLTNIVLLSRNIPDKQAADEEVMMLLLNIRQYLKEKGNAYISITSEMRLTQNQILLQKNSGNDFVVSSEITNHMIAQITDDPRKYSVISELLEQKNALIELHRISDYVDVSQQFNFECVFRTASEGKEIPLGWICVSQDSDVTDDCAKLALNPSKEQLEKCLPAGSYDNYRLIVLTNKSV